MRPNGIKKLTTARCRGRQLAIGLIAAMLHLTALRPFAATSVGEKASGMINVTGRVTINETLAIFGQTIFTGTRIVTANRSTSMIHLNGQSRLNLYPESALFLKFSRVHITGTLTNGKLSGFVPPGVSAVIETNSASIATDASEPAVFSIEVSPDGTNVTVETGRVEVTSQDTHTSVKSGESFSAGSHQPLLAHGPPQTLDNNKLGWVIAGVGAAIAVVLVAILGRSPDDSDFGGCVTVSGNIDPPPVCL